MVIKNNNVNVLFKYIVATLTHNTTTIAIIINQYNNCFKRIFKIIMSFKDPQLMMLVPHLFNEMPGRCKGNSYAVVRAGPPP